MSFFAFTTRAARDAYVAALDLRLGLPRRCPQRLVAPGTPEAACWTMTAVASEDASDGSFLCGAYPGERTPLGATRVRVDRVGDTAVVARKVALSEPTSRQLDEAAESKRLRTVTAEADDPTRTR